MERVTVAELKARLSHYLREVREGKSFTVVSRDIPVAHLGPVDIDDWDDIEAIEPTESTDEWGKVDLPPLGKTIDVVALLREDRDERDERLAEIVREALRDRRASGGPDE
jgi:prevent-host-death family protein